MSTPKSMQDHLPVEDTLIDAEIDDAGVQEQRPTLSRPWLLLLGLILVGINLRPALSSLAPVLGDVAASRGLSGMMAGLLTTLPVACLGLFGLLAPRLARRWGSEKTIALILVTLALGILLRTQFGQVGLFAGSALAGASIGIIGVLLPGIVKRDFPRQVSLMTGVYTMALCLGAALAAGLTVPAMHAMGDSWQGALAIWATPALLALLCWWPQTRSRQAAHHGQWLVRGLLRDPLAWQVTLFMGLQSSMAYIVFGWLPSILIDRGQTPLHAGLLLSISIMVQVASSLLVPALGQRCRDQRPPIAATVALVLSGLLGMLFAPTDSLLFWAVLLGLGQGGLFSMALSLLALRSPDPHVAAHLSGMAQGVGYALASLGPLSVGLIRDQTHSLWPLGLLFVLISTVTFSMGMLAGRKRLVQVESRPL